MASGQTVTPVTAENSASKIADNVINVGTRKSILARIQTDIVVGLLQKAWPDKKFNIIAISTMGDKDKVTALNEFNAKSLWTFELEEMLLQGEIDFIVHSLKGNHVLISKFLACTC